MSERDPIEYLLNAMERAAQQDQPAAHGYGDKRRAVLEAIRTLRRERDELAQALREYIEAADQCVSGEDDAKAMLRFGVADRHARALLAALPGKEDGKR